MTFVDRLSVDDADLQHCVGAVVRRRRRDEPDGSFGCKGAPDRDGPALLELAYHCRKAVEPPPARLATPLDGRAHELVGNEQHRSTIASGRAFPAVRVNRRAALPGTEHGSPTLRSLARYVPIARVPDTRTCPGTNSRP